MNSVESRNSIEFAEYFCKNNNAYKPAWKREQHADATSVPGRQRYQRGSLN